MQASSVLPLALKVGTSLFPQCRQRVTLSMDPISALIRFKLGNRNLVPAFVVSSVRRGTFMQEAVDRVMQAYGLMVTISPEEQAEARERLRKHLSGMPGDENALAVEGLRFLRNPRPSPR
jgi:hypothetical protein